MTVRLHSGLEENSGHRQVSQGERGACPRPLRGAIQALQALRSSTTALCPGGRTLPRGPAVFFLDPGGACAGVGEEAGRGAAAGSAHHLLTASQGLWSAPPRSFGSRTDQSVCNGKPEHVRAGRAVDCGTELMATLQPECMAPARRPDPGFPPPLPAPLPLGLPDTHGS